MDNSVSSNNQPQTPLAVHSKPPEEVQQIRNKPLGPIQVELINEIVEEDSKTFDASIILGND